MNNPEISPKFIADELKRLEETKDLTQTQAIQELIAVFGSKAVANYLNWSAERKTDESIQ